MPTVYSYVVAHDTGAAPNVDGGICTLAICKPTIRLKAQEGDWIVGLWPVPDRHCITFVMRVGSVLSYADYWNDPRFAIKKPGQSPQPDNIYRPGQKGAFVWVKNPVHAREKAEKDLRGKHVLIADRFWYFGGQQVKLPHSYANDLDLPNPRRGHRRSAWTDAKMRRFQPCLK